MMELYVPKFKPFLPFKSVAVALLFSILLGPLGLLYASVRGGVTLILLSFIVLSSHFWFPMAILWVSACVWGVSATNRYNKKLLAWITEKNEFIKS